MPAGESKGVFVAFASCGLLVVLVLFLSTLALSQLGAFPWTGGHGHAFAKVGHPGDAAQIQDLVTPEDSSTTEAPPVHRPVVPRNRDRGWFPLLPTELYTNASHQYFCFYQARAERPESAGLLFGLSLFPYHLCTHAVYCCAHLSEPSLQIEAPSDAHGFPRHLRGLNPHLRPLLGLDGRMPAAMMSGSDWIFLESAVVWLTPRGYQGAVLLWKISLETLAARRGYRELLERVAHRFDREGFVLSVLVDTGASLEQRLDLSELDAALPGGGDHPTASLLLYPIVGEPPVDRIRGVEDARSAVVYEKNRLRDAIKQLQSTLRQARVEQQSPSTSLGGADRGDRPAGANHSSADKLCYVFSFAGITYKFWDSNATGVQELVYGPGDPGPSTKTPGERAYYEICNEVWDSSQVYEFGVVSKQGANWVSHLTEFVVPPLARYLRDQFGVRCFGVWNAWHDDFAGVCGGGQYPLMRNLFGVFSNRR
ncbi:chitotriosidase-1-like [Dermacentor silvarum]|uniref:chitotriosidase-1-like n=1 Tax=Dermacentor silvarum TaxID=543639 RepID=UPI00210071CA|nr:chitotriosidase-1-like [Dermacentor silvarum]